MNSFQGHIIDINTHGHLSLVKVKMINDLVVSSIVIDTPSSADYLQVNNSINILFKETEVIISTSESPAISLQNKIKGTILSIEKGALLSRLVINTIMGEVVAIISSNAVDQLALTPETKVTIMIKLNEVTLSP